MLLDAHGYSHYHENNLRHDVFAFLQNSYKTLESYFWVFMASLEDNMIACTTYVNETAPLYPNN